MNRRFAIPAVVIAVAIAVTAYYFGVEDSPDASSQTNSQALPRASSATSVQAAASTAPSSPNPIAVRGELQAPPTSDGSADKFQVDADGHLLLNEKTRLYIESLVALSEPGKLDERTQEAVRELPPGAAARANDLVDRFRVYMIAQKEAYPPGVPPVDVDDMLTQQDGLHALRVAHFGQETAEAFYGEEEKTNRDLLEIMRVDKDKGLSLEEKAERAQALLDKQRRESEAKKN